MRMTPPCKGTQAFFLTLRLLFITSLLISTEKAAITLGLACLAAHALLAIRTSLAHQSSTTLPNLVDYAAIAGLLTFQPTPWQLHSALALAACARPGSSRFFLLLAAPFAIAVLGNSFQMASTLIPEALLLVGLGYWIKIQREMLKASNGIDQENGLYNLQGLTMALRLYLPYMHRNHIRSTLILLRISIHEPFHKKVMRSIDRHIDLGLTNLIQHRLRRCDVISRYKPLCYSILLLDTDPGNASLVARELHSLIEQWRNERKINLQSCFAVIPLPPHPISTERILAHGESGLKKMQPSHGDLNLIHLDSPS